MPSSQISLKTVNVFKICRRVKKFTFKHCKVALLYRHLVSLQYKLDEINEKKLSSFHERENSITNKRQIFFSWTFSQTPTMQFIPTIDSSPTKAPNPQNQVV